MTKQIVEITVDSNEQNFERIFYLQELVTKRSDRFTLDVKSAPIDMVMRYGDQEIGFELKETTDYWGSMFNGHLADQSNQAATINGPCFTVIFGSLEDVQEDRPTMTDSGYQGYKKQEQYFNQIEGLDAALFSVNFFPLYLSRDHELTFKYLLSRGRRWLLGGSMVPWLVKRIDPQVAAFYFVEKIGAKKAQALVDAGVRLQLDETDCKVRNVSGIGPKIEKNLRDAYGVLDVDTEEMR